MAYGKIFMTAAPLRAGTRSHEVVILDHLPEAHLLDRDSWERLVWIRPHRRVLPMVRACLEVEGREEAEGGTMKNKDTERLDWLSRAAREATPGGWWCVNYDGNIIREDGAGNKDNYAGWAHPTIRGAIDAAMKVEKKRKERP